MIEFTIRKCRKGKKGRWSKKYPRKSILRKGSKVVGWYANNWIDDNYRYIDGDLDKFLLANVGRPVDKVFSEFLQRCKKSVKKYNLRERFYSMFQNKEDISYVGGFYITNGIINHKKRRKKPDNLCTFTSCEGLASFNSQHFPSKNVLYNTCKKAEQSHERQLIGEFYVSEDWYGKLRKTSVYIATKEDYKENYFYMNLSIIAGIGIGVDFSVYKTQSKLEEITPRYMPYDEFRWSSHKRLPDYVFLTKVEISDKQI